MVTIKKVKRKGDGLLLNCDRTISGHTFQSPGEIHPTPIHDDLDTAIDGLRIHFACILGLVATKKIKDITAVKPEMLSDFRVTGYSITRKGDGVVITGMIKAPSGRWSAINTSATRFEEDEASKYYFMDNLQADLKSIESEISQYLAGDKVGVAKQGTLEMPDAVENEPDEDEQTED